MPGWRALGVVWLAVIVAAAGGAVALDRAGPPPSAKPPEPAAKQPPPPPEPAPPATLTAANSAPGPAANTAPWPGPPIAARDPSRPITAPDLALSEAAPDYPGARLPKIAPDGRTSLSVYARPFNFNDKRPRVAILVTGLGLSEQLSRLAIDALPPEISLGFSPYTHDPEVLLSTAAARGHEYFVTLPMESQGYPLNDSGPHELLTGADPADNARNLEWVLSRMQGEVGISGASDGLRGERFASASGAIGPVLKQLAQRGLVYVDPRPGPARGPGEITVSVVVDEPPTRADLDAKLTELERKARETGAALGLAGTLRPVTIERILVWARGLDARGIALAPVSALVYGPR